MCVPARSPRAVQTPTQSSAPRVLNARNRIHRIPSRPAAGRETPSVVELEAASPATYIRRPAPPVAVSVALAVGIEPAERSSFVRLWRGLRRGVRREVWYPPSEVTPPERLGGRHGRELRGRRTTETHDH